MKNYLNLFVPPIFSYLYKRLPIHDFKIFWKKVENDKKINEEIKFITNNFVKSESYSFVSRYWHFLNIKNFKYIIENEGIDNYSQNIAKNYFTTLIPTNSEIKTMMDKIQNERISIGVDLFKKHEKFTYVESLNYNLILVMLYQNLKKTKTFEKLVYLSDEGFLGYSDPFLEIEKIKVTHDKLNSLFDLHYISESEILNNDKSILEIGAGSGRTSETIMTFYKNLKYVICDIPPAIYISYKRLKKRFPEKKIKLLFDLKGEKEILNAINGNDLCFCFPHQLNLIKEFKFDTTIAIDCLHEMDKKIIKYYFLIINKLSKNFYFSVRNETLVPFSYRFFTSGGNLLKLDDKSYPIMDNWELKQKKSLIYPADYSCLSYRINK